MFFYEPCILLPYTLHLYETYLSNSKVSHTKFRFIQILIHSQNSYLPKYLHSQNSDLSNAQVLYPYLATIPGQQQFI
jgi:hypothetical protein